MMPPPAGFTRTELIDPFEIHVGPVFERGAKGARRFAFVIDERHINMRGVTLRSGRRPGMFAITPAV
jgi:hypothetical protein